MYDVDNEGSEKEAVTCRTTKLELLPGSLWLRGQPEAKLSAEYGESVRMEVDAVSQGGDETLRWDCECEGFASIMLIN